MKRGNKEFTDKKVTIFLIAAIFISLVSTWTVLVTLSEVIGDTNNPKVDQKYPNQVTKAGVGVISLTILEPEELINGTR